MYVTKLRLSILLLTCMVFQPVATYAQFAGGTGEPNDPYQIATAEQLIAIGSDPNLLDKSFTLVADIDLDPNLPGGRVFTNALIARDKREDVSGHSGDLFVGVLDGRGHTIDNLHIEGSYGYDAGLFGMLAGSVKDLSLTNVVVSGSPCGAIAGLNRGVITRCRVTGQVSGIDRVGGLAGGLWDGNLIECQVQVQISGKGSVGGMVGNISGGSLIRCQAQAEVVGIDRVGGIIGSGRGTLIGCEAQAEVVGANDVGGMVGQASGTLMECKVNAEVTGQRRVGGLVGRLGSNGQIIECMTVGIVTGNTEVGGLVGQCGEAGIYRSSANSEVSAEQVAGGLVGSTESISGPFVADCYALGSISGAIVGGLMGEVREVKAMNCYSASLLVGLEVDDGDTLVGGLFGNLQLRRSIPLVIACFWDAELSPIVHSTGSDPLLGLGTGLTTGSMLEGNEFRNAGWDFNHTWMTCEGDYPKLQWQTDDCSVTIREGE